MPVSLKNKLSQFEAVPPAGAWEKIAMQLDEEFVAADGPLSLKLEDAVVEPPVGMFSRIEAELDESVVVKPAKVVPMYRRMAVAAVMIGVLVLTAFYFLSDNVEDGKKEIVRNADLSAPITSLKSGDEDTSNELIASDDPAPGGNDAKTSPARRIATIARNSSPVVSQVSYTDMDIDDPKPVQMVSAMEPVQVNAPPIRDARGNVIMDMSVISNPNEPYITVTSPNGSQTNISKKFLSCLSYLNGNYSASEINYEGQQWKSRFAEWRNKISEAGFVPGANNFFDIFELQELIRD